MEENSDTLKDIAKQVKSIRKKRFKTQELFAQKINMNYSKYTRFEKSGQISFEGFIDILSGLDILDDFKNLFKVDEKVEAEKNLFALETQDEEIMEVEVKKEIVHTTIKEANLERKENSNLDIKRVVSFFDQERKKLQPNYVRKEFKNTDGEYLLRVHMHETQRTAQMFYDAIRWLFSSSPKAQFHRQYIMNIAKLIEHFNTLEHEAMYSKEEIKFNEEGQVWYNIYKKQGLEHQAILEQLREGGFIK